MTVLEDYQYELLELETDAEGFVFGLDRPLFTQPGFVPGITSWRSQSGDIPGRAGRREGRDFAAAPTWNFPLGVDEQSDSDALATLGDGATAWRARRVRETPGAVSALRYAIGGRTRRVYGRPKNWGSSPENRILTGYIPVEATFDCSDELHYDDVLNRAVMGTVAAKVGGWVTPFVFPLSSVNTRSERDGQLLIEGDEPTWVTVELAGPLAAGARLQLPGWSIVTTKSIPYDVTITIDPRPWSTRITRNDGASAASYFDSRLRMDLMRLAPGGHQAIFTGVDATGTAHAAVSWRAAYSSL